MYRNQQNIGKILTLQIMFYSSDSLKLEYVNMNGRILYIEDEDIDLDVSVSDLGIECQIFSINYTSSNPTFYTYFEEIENCQFRVCFWVCKIVLYVTRNVMYTGYSKWNELWYGN